MDAVNGMAFEECPHRDLIRYICAIRRPRRLQPPGKPGADTGNAQNPEMRSEFAQRREIEGQPVGSVRDSLTQEMGRRIW